MTDRPLSPDEIFDQVADLSSAERLVQLDKLCAQNLHLRQEIDSLLVAWDDCGVFMDTPVDLETTGITGEPVAPADLSGQSIGPWLLQELLGFGGMGDVWRATREVEGGQQTVALKIIRTAVFAPDALTRFRNECRVLAMLEHPGIARLIEGSVTPDGTPYLVVEYVEGQTIDKWCAEQNPSLPERIKLVVDVCEAVRHLNRHSVIHRDIKTANVLVGAGGRTKLIDFGIARILDAAGEDGDLTLTGTERMTPTYASPEQLRGEPLSIASDVYSLGVLTFMLLTGGLPHANRKRWELAKEIAGSAPPKLSEAKNQAGLTTRFFHGDLDTIVQTALHPEVSRRYPSADSLREDLTRYLAGQPVLARGDSFFYVTGKFVRRHAIAVVFAALALIILAGGMITGFTLYGRAESARQEAETQQQTAEQISSFLETLLAAVNPSTSGARQDLTVREALDAAAERVGRELSEQPVVAASLHGTIGSAYLNLGLLRKADEHLLAAESILGTPDIADTEGQANARVYRGKVAHEEGRFEEAEELLISALSAKDESTLATAQLYLSELYGDQSRLEEAESAAQSARQYAERPTMTDPMLPAQAISQMGVILYRQGRYAEAETTMAAAVDQALGDLGDSHVLTGECTQNLGVVQAALSRHAEAILAFEDALKIYERVYPPGHHEFAVTLLGLGDAQTALGQHEKALITLQEAQKIFAENQTSTKMNLGLATNAVAHCHRQLGNVAAAGPLFEEAIALISGQLGAHHPWTAAIKNNLAWVRLESGNQADARVLATQVLEDMQAAYPDGHAYLARPLGLLAELDLLQGRYAAASRTNARADSLTATLAPASRERADIGLQRARLNQLQGHHKIATAILDSLLVLAAGANDQGLYLQAEIADLRTE